MMSAMIPMLPLPESSLTYLPKNDAIVGYDWMLSLFIDDKDNDNCLKI